MRLSTLDLELDKLEDCELVDLLSSSFCKAFRVLDKLDIPMSKKSVILVFFYLTMKILKRIIKE